MNSKLSWGQDTAFSRTFNVYDNGRKIAVLGKIFSQKTTVEINGKEILFQPRDFSFNRKIDIIDVLKRQVIGQIEGNSLFMTKSSIKIGHKLFAYKMNIWKNEAVVFDSTELRIVYTPSLSSLATGQIEINDKVDIDLILVISGLYLMNDPFRILIVFRIFIGIFVVFLIAVFILWQIIPY